MPRSAFSRWLERESKGSTEHAAAILFGMMKQNPSSDNLVWDLLERTGQKTYDGLTFLKAAEIALTNDMPEEDSENE